MSQLHIFKCMYKIWGESINESIYLNIVIIIFKINNNMINKIFIYDLHIQQFYKNH